MASEQSEWPRRAIQALLLAATALALVWLLRTPTARSEDPFLRRTPTVRAVQRAGPSVVNITSERILDQSPFRRVPSRDPRFDRFFQDYFDRRTRPRTAQSLGSGVLIDADRHVLTNEHVIDRADAIRVTLADGREFDAELVGADPTNDLAVLRVATDESLPWIPLGRSDDLMVGEPVIAIGNPHGLSNTVTTGVVSALHRSLNTGAGTFHGFIQTDASINPGNSGGPLLNAEATLVGINTAVFWRPDQPTQGIGFAIPIAVAARVIDELIAYGEVQPVWLGMEFQNLGPQLHDVLHLPEHVSGVLVNAVEPGSPADRAGIERGDIVMQMDRRTLEDAADLHESLCRVRTDQDVELSVWRDGEERDPVLRAAELPDARVPGIAQALLGLRLEPGRSGAYEVTRVRPDSAAEQIGFQAGDQLLELNGRALETRSDLRHAVAGLRCRSVAQLIVARGGGRYRVVVPVG